MNACRTVRTLLLLVTIVVAVPALPAWSDQAPLPLGTISVTSTQAVVLPGYNVQSIHVVCPSVAQAADGFIATSTRPVSRGTILFFSGGTGTTWYGSDATSTSGLADLANRGFRVVQVRWRSPWWQASSSENVGPSRLACRPATVVKWAYDRLYAPLGLNPGLGQCGFCATGNSGGASQVSYAVSAYGLAPVLDAIVPTSGPPHASQSLGCERNATQERYWYDTGASNTIDSSYGYLTGSGPCSQHVTTFESRWLAESVDTGARSLFYPSTRVQFIFGQLDRSNAVPLGQRFLAALRNAGSPMVSSQVVAGTSHGVSSTSQGMQAIENALLGT